MSLDLKIEQDLGFTGRATVENASPVAVSPPVTGEVLAGVDRTGAYEGASRLRNEMASWVPSNRSADMDIMPDKQLADARSKDIVRNDPLLQAGLFIRKDSIVGANYTLSSRPNYQYLGLDDKWATEFAEEVEMKFHLWANSVNNWPDAARINDFTGLIRLAVGTELYHGEALATAEWIQYERRPYRTAIQMIDPDRLSTPASLVDANIHGGVEKNSNGRPIAYHIRMAHPGDYNAVDGWKWKRVASERPWGRKMVIHAFEQNRADQSRGISELAAGLSDMRMLKKFRKMVLENAILNATFAASIESEVPASAFSAIGVAGEADPVGSTYQSYLSMLEGYQTGAGAIKLDGVKIPHLAPGTKLQLRPVGAGGPLGTEFEMSCHRYLAATLGVSYEELLHDYTNTNLSSAKAAFGNTEKRMRAKKKYTADTFANAIFGLWFEEAIDKGEIEAMKGAKVPDMWDRNTLNFEAFTNAVWMGSGQASLDPLKERRPSKTWQRATAKTGGS
jgi:lambda family phage portal protein